MGPGLKVTDNPRNEGDAGAGKLAGVDKNREQTVRLQLRLPCFLPSSWVAWLVAYIKSRSYPLVGCHEKPTLP
jgi:hypothetical protein